MLVYFPLPVCDSRQSDDDPDKGVKVGVAELLHPRGERGTEEGVSHPRVVAGFVDMSHLVSKAECPVFKQFISLIQDQPLHTGEREQLYF